MSAATAVRELLVATDFSDEAEAAVGVAIDYARRLGARLHVLHVLSREDVDVTQRLSDASAPAGSDVPVIIASIAGDPAEEILAYARRHPIGLVVVGTHGRSGFSRMLLGSVAERVLRGASCPVLTVPPGAVAAAPSAMPAAADRAPQVPRRCIVCAKLSPDLVCEPCRARIRGEAIDRKQREERPGRG